MKRRLVSGLALSLVLAASSFGSLRGAVVPGTVNQGIIKIRIHDYAQVKPSVLLSATKAASDILREAGVDTVWVECPVGQTLFPDSVCTNPMTPLDLVLNLLPRSRAQYFRLQDETLGVAMVAGGQDFGFFASVFYDSVKAYAGHHKLRLPQLLGHTIVHEIGHLLLGAAHSANGVMRACWSGKELLAAEQGKLSFSFSEKNQLQTTLTARRQATLHGDKSPEVPLHCDFHFSCFC